MTDQHERAVRAHSPGRRRVAGYRRDATSFDDRAAVSPSPESDTVSVAPSQDGRPPGGLTDVLNAVVAPGTLILAVGYLFARSYTASFFDYFGVDIDVLGFSNQAIAVRSSNVLWIILFAVFFAALLVGALQTAVSRLASSAGFTMLRWLYLVTVLIVLASGVAALVVYSDDGGSIAFLALLAAGIAASSYALYIRARSRLAYAPRSTVGRRLMVLGTAGALSLLLFALTSAIASYQGRSAALNLSRAPDFYRPSMVLDTRERLYTSGINLEEASLSQDVEGGQVFRYRYRGLVLLAAGSGKLILIPNDWNRRTGFALVLPDDNQIRVQYVVREP